VIAARSGAWAELSKLSAFARRDLLVRLSYRTALISDWVNILAQAVIFAYVSKLIKPSALPTYGDQQTSYIAFVSVGLTISVFLQVGVGQIATAVRSEQLMGTLEALLVTPTRSATLLVGTVIYDLIYVPIRTGLFLIIVAVWTGVSFATSGVLPAGAILLAFTPFVWGLGAAVAAATLTFKRAAVGVGVATFVLTISSGTYFPLTLFPSWVQTLAKVNPVAVALDGMRSCLLGGEGWSQALPAIGFLAACSAVTLAAGLFAFRLALRREARLGTVALY
jgi:ABC-2 type transport system permease protein